MQQGIRVRVGAVIVRKSAIVLVEYDDDKSGRHFNLPGGGVTEGESLHDALRREISEETRMEVDVGRLLLVWEYVPCSLCNGQAVMVVAVFISTLASIP